VAVSNCAYATGGIRRTTRNRTSMEIGRVVLYKRLTCSKGDVAVS
jgi:hypothetical protein